MGDAPHQKLATITFQNLFPPINVRKVKLSTCQRAAGPYTSLAFQLNLSRPEPSVEFRQ